MILLGWARALEDRAGRACPSWWARLGVILVLLGGCRAEAERTGAGTGEPAPPEQKSVRPVRVAPEVLRDAGIEVAPVSLEALAPSLSLPGEVVAIPDRCARVSTPLAGRIERVLFNEGDRVKRGERLLLVRVPDLGKVRAGFAASAARGKAARAQADRARKLLPLGAVSERDVLEAEAQAQAIEADTRALGEQLAALGLGATEGGAFDLSLTAPVTGVVTRRDAVVGQPVSVDQSVAEIADLREVWFLAHVYEKDLGRVRLGADAEVRLNAYPGEASAGSVGFVGAQVDPVSRTITARIPLENRGDRLRIGLFGAARVTIPAEAPGPALPVVPRAALGEIDGKPVVFVRIADGEFEPRPVLTGDSARGKVAVTAGLREGEVVAVKGVFSLKSIALKSTFSGDE